MNQDANPGARKAEDLESTVPVLGTDGTAVANRASKTNRGSLTPLREMKLAALMVRRLSAWMAVHSPYDADQATRAAFGACADEVAVLHDKLMDWSILAAGWKSELDEVPGEEEGEAAAERA